MTDDRFLHHSLSTTHREQPLSNRLFPVFFIYVFVHREGEIIMQDIILQNLVSPAVLFFVLGLLAALVKSDLKFPKALSESLSIYLLAAIGLKGGIEMSKHSFATIAWPTVGTIVLGCLVPVLTFLLCRWLVIDRKNSAALAATYGSVSIVTFGAAVQFLQSESIPFESYMTAMVVILETPAILISLIILRTLESREENERRQRMIDPEVLKESFFGKSIILMVGGMLVGLIAGTSAVPVVKPLFIDLYPSVLVIFLLGMGLVAGERLKEIGAYGVKLILLAVVMPLLWGTLGLVIGYWCGLSTGGMMIMGVLGASASYIAAPAAIKTSIPDANPSIYIGMSLGITFPFNLIFGIPLYLEISKYIHG